MSGPARRRGSGSMIRTSSPHVDIQENVRPGGYVPEERLKDMDLDGIDVDMMYPTAGLFHYRLAVDGELLSAILGTYNDWLAEFCKPYPDRLKGIGMINIDDVDEGVRELECCANLGLVGAMIPTSLAEGKSYALPDYEPLWAAAQDLRVPLSLHIGTSRSGPDENLLPPHLWSPSVFVNLDPPLRDTLCDMIFAGVFERYPELPPRATTGCRVRGRRSGAGRRGLISTEGSQHAIQVLIIGEGSQRDDRLG